ncbi:MAG: HIT domain-containing protein [Deltaproteobacteria bacterium]|nr:HIT domain-containing protein [Deltaproteobacteria bacterium]
MFELDPRLQADTIPLGDFPLCRLLLMNEQSYPWFILVPRREKSREIHRLSETDQGQLWRESARLSRWMESAFKFDKLNIAALGNVVSQLHLHHVGRRIGDPAWPGPVWGQHPPVPYAEDRIGLVVRQVKVDLADLLIE